MAQIETLTDKLLEKIEQAITELDIQLYECVDKEKTIEYDNRLRPDKPTREVVHESKKVTEQKSIIDRAGLRQITAALRDIKEIKMLRSELDRREQEARIANLQRLNATNDDDDETGVIMLAPVLEEDNDG